MMQLKSNGLAGTILFHGILLLMLFYFKFITPLPLPTEQGILVNFGTDNFGAGSRPVVATDPAETPMPVSVPTQQSAARQTVLTQEFEEAPVIEPKAKKQQTRPVEKKTEPVVVAKTPDAPAEKPREVNQRLLYRGAKSNQNSGVSEGVTSGTGDQGSKSGSTSSTNYGQGGGTGNSGISFDLAGRTAQSLPKPEYKQQEQGKVVVEVTVDQEGRVTSAIPGVKGSNTLNSYLLEMAKKAALAARFDRKPDAPAFQKGTITYYFVLQ